MAVYAKVRIQPKIEKANATFLIRGLKGLKDKFLAYFKSSSLDDL